MTRKVCAIVLNSVSHDVRVIKEAESLAAAGYEVSIVGIQDANDSAPTTTLESGVEIYRVAWKARAIRPAYYSFLLRIAALLIVVGILWSLPRRSELIAWRFVAGLAGRVEAGAAADPVLTALQVLATVGVLYVAWLVWARYTARKVTYANVNAVEINVQLPLTEAEEKARVKPPRPLFRLPVWLFVLIKYPRNLELVMRQFLVAERERAICELVTEMRPDIVHCHDIGALPAGAKVKAATGCKLVFDAHEIYDQLAQTNAAESSLNRYVATLYADKVDAFITINDSIATYYRRKFPYLPTAAVVRNATRPIDSFAYDGRLHEAAGVGPETKILLYQGGFADKRGLVPLVQSAWMLPEDWILVMMGWGRFEDELRKAAKPTGGQVKKSQLSRYHRIALPRNRVRFVGRAPQEELPLWTAGATVGIIPYENVGMNHWFCTPNKLWEYPNAGVPILASPFPEMRRIIEGHKIGWLLPLVLTPEGIAEAVAKITEPEIAQAKANCATFIAEDNWDRYGARLVELYSTIESPPARARGGALAMAAQ